MMTTWGWALYVVVPFLGFVLIVAAFLRPRFRRLLLAIAILAALAASAWHLLSARGAV